MKKIYQTIFALIIFVQLSKSQNPTPKDCSVELWASVEASPPTITLNWLPNVGTTNYAVDRKLKNASVWTPLAATLPSTTTQYVDNTVSVGVNYEYRVRRTASTGAVNYTGYGYINSGIEIPVTENRGKLILLVADNFSLSLAPEIKRLEDDMEGDGWEVITSYVSTTTAVPDVKDTILNIYNLDPANTKALFLLGHIPVPYSGNFGPDGHTDHQGAWATDVYYAELNGTWTDISVNVTSGLPARTQNIPGDGKFDQWLIPSGTVELQVGRVDLYGMPSFTATETELTKNYLNKDHDYRKKIFSPEKRAVLEDNFGYFAPGEVFASSGFKNFGPLVTPSNVVVADYFTTMTGNSYQWSYGCGGGSYTSAGGIGNTANFTNSDLQGVFTMLFGSYFGDWDISNNFLKAPLCQGKTLTNAWAGRPNWMFHHMGLGENIGYSTMLTQNNTTLYFGSPFAPNQGMVNSIHISLMGDPTLRNDIVAPVSNVVATKVGNDCHISWSASTETTLVGYNIYMKNDTNTNYVKINSTPISGTTYTDYCLPYLGTYKYMVRALKLETTPSGSYYNMSEGIADTAYNSSHFTVQAQFANTQSGATVSFNNLSNKATNYVWDFGDGQNSTAANPSVTYTANGFYIVTLIASNNCDADTIIDIITVSTVGLKELHLFSDWNIFPNPASTFVMLSNEACQNCTLSIFNSEGKQVYFQNNLSEQQTINVSGFKKGIYLIRLSDNKNRSVSRKLIVE
ncbi:MAG: T9SS type A sorting domain-containing protein [Bacteroidetes bacterium]|nr:T9SS type A sorting domain-containing protein [Bacteroidota bacterium]